MIIIIMVIIIITIIIIIMLVTIVILTIMKIHPCLVLNRILTFRPLNKRERKGWFVNQESTFRNLTRSVC